MQFSTRSRAVALTSKTRLCLRKGKVREEVVGVEDKTKIEKGGANVNLRDLQESDLALINYVPEAYTPVIAIRVTGKGKIQKLGGRE